MWNPFANDSRLYKSRDAGAKFCVVVPESDTQTDVMGFMDRHKAWDYAAEMSGYGLWAYVIELRYMHVDLALPAYFNKENQHV